VSQRASPAGMDSKAEQLCRVNAEKIEREVRIHLIFRCHHPAVLAQNAIEFLVPMLRRHYISFPSVLIL
jgi:hypothetical protein